jgi:hypothetical protein
MNPRAGLSNQSQMAQVERAHVEAEERTMSTHTALLAVTGKLRLAFVAAGIGATFALGTPARADMPIMDDPLPLTVRGDTGRLGLKARTNAKPASHPYKTYRDRLGFGNVTSSAFGGGSAAPAARRRQ